MDERYLRQMVLRQQGVQLCLGFPETLGVCGINQKHDGIHLQRQSQYCSGISLTQRASPVHWHNAPPCVRSAPYPDIGLTYYNYATWGMWRSQCHMYMNYRKLS